ncbi:DUF2867 domain-containing protein [Pseudomonas sp.]|uniref:DUF2867 domain-containing protein n=1 Tax=Pseudomonas sp. TaxID=306 RepID=UPI00345CFA88
MPELDYYDRRSVSLPVHITPLADWNIIMAKQGLIMPLAFRIRDAISSLFGVKRIGGFSGTARKTVAVGEYLDLRRPSPGLMTKAWPLQRITSSSALKPNARWVKSKPSGCSRPLNTPEICA